MIALGAAGGSMAGDSKVAASYGLAGVLRGIGDVFRHWVLSIRTSIIGAFIGTTDLGQLILKSISEPQGTGIGITLGLCVAFIGLAVDQIIRTWANRRKKMLGLS